MDVLNIRIAGHHGLAAAMEGALIGFGWGLIGLVTAAIIQPEAIGPVGSFNLGAIFGLTTLTAGAIGIVFGI